MIKLSYSPTFTFSSVDIFDYADSAPITYEVYARLPSRWAELSEKWRIGNFESVDMALDMIGLAIVSVSQNGERFPLAGRAGAEALRDAIEESNPGYGDTFIKHLAIGHRALHWRRAEERLGNSKTPSALSADGNSPGA